LPKPLIAISFILLAFISSRAIDSSSATAPEIKGSEQFIDQVQKALLLLKERNADAYAIVTNYVGLIQENKISGMDPLRTPPTYYMSDITAFASVTWCAATIAHDSFHSKLYHEYRRAHDGPVPSTIWKGREAEQQCIKHQLAVMERIGASIEEIDHSKALEDGRFVNDDGTQPDYLEPW
jgi:hypothetical protein